MTTSIITRESDHETGEGEIERMGMGTVANTGHTSSNMREYLTGGTRVIPVRESVASVVNAETISEQTSFDNRVPLNLLPYKKDQITINHARKTYRYRHVLRRNDSTIGLFYSDASSVTEYRAELEILFDAIMAVGKLVYQRQLVHLASEMGINRWDKQTILSFSDLQQWAVHPSNHGNHPQQIEVL
jgi:hypothetical protein